MGKSRECGQAKFIAAAAILAALLPAAAFPSPSPSTLPVLGRLIQALADTDPQVRLDAARQILAQGREARAALVEAYSGDEPQVRLTASQLVLQLPFDEPGDPPATRAFLAPWGRADVAHRIGLLTQLVKAADKQAASILLRLMREDPSDQVRWAIVGQLRHLHPSGFPLPATAFAPAQERAPNLALFGWALEKSDYPAAMRLYWRCADLEAQHPTVDGGEGDFVFGTLYQISVLDHRFEDAARVLRVQFGRQPEGSGSQSNKLDELFALHARFGPLASFPADVENFGSFFDRPSMLYAAGRMVQRRLGQPLLADAIYRAAYAASFGSTETRDAAGEFLTNQQWNDLALAELKTMLALENKPTSIHFANAQLRLGVVYARLGDDLAAAEHKRAAMESLEKMSGFVTRTKGARRYSGKEAADLMWAEVHWHFFRAARAKGDREEMDRQITALLAFAPDDEQLVLDVLPVLVDARRLEEAARLFAKPFQSLKSALDKNPDDAEKLNNIAWLCARAGQNLQQADSWSKRSLEIRPDHYAYLDTAAEVQFRLGHIDEAIRLEQRALERQPGDDFLQSQLKRFQAAKNAGNKP